MAVPKTKLIRSPVVISWSVLAIALILLELAIVLGLASEYIVARPTVVISSLGRLFAEDGLGWAFLITIAQTATAVFVAILVGLPLGLLLYRYRILGRAYRGWLAALFAAPMVLLYPLFLVVFGRNYSTVIIMGCITGMIPMILYMYEALLNVPKTLLNVGRSFNLSDRDLFRKIEMPAAVPNAFTGVRLGLIYALVNIIGIEFLIDFGGLGRVVSDMFFRYDVPGMYAAITFIVIVSLLFMMILKRVEQWLRPE